MQIDLPRAAPNGFMSKANPLPAGSKSRKNKKRSSAKSKGTNKAQDGLVLFDGINHLILLSRLHFFVFAVFLTKWFFHYSPSA